MTSGPYFMSYRTAVCQILLDNRHKIFHKQLDKVIFPHTVRKMNPGVTWQVFLGRIWDFFMHYNQTRVIRSSKLAARQTDQKSNLKGPIPKSCGIRPCRNVCMQRCEELLSYLNQSLHLKCLHFVKDSPFLTFIMLINRLLVSPIKIKFDIQYANQQM